jgi:hypothetical protein
VAVIISDAAQISADKLNAGDDTPLERRAQLGNRGFDEMKSGQAMTP